jgi:hypothetical protein
MFAKNEGSDELQMMSNEVLKKGIGLDIEIKPILPQKK